MSFLSGWLGLALPIVFVAGGIGAAAPALGQAAAVRTVLSDPVIAGCPAMAKLVPPSDVARRAARSLAVRAQEAAIVDDNATARDLYERAVKLDPTDAATAYALARAYETASDPRALVGYCRFLALAPTAPEAVDVRQRVVSLSSALAARNAEAAVVTVDPRNPLPDAGTAFTIGLVLPGFGQYYSHRPVAGALFTAAAAGALLFGFQSQTVTTTTPVTATDPNGKSYQYQQITSHDERPNATAGFAVAATISVIGAVEAYLHARSAGVDDVSPRVSDAGTTSQLRTASPVVAVLGRAVGVGLQLPVTLSR